MSKSHFSNWYLAFDSDSSDSMDVIWQWQSRVNIPHCDRWRVISGWKICKEVWVPVDLLPPPYRARVTPWYLCTWRRFWHTPAEGMRVPGVTCHPPPYGGWCRLWSASTIRHPLLCCFGLVPPSTAFSALVTPLSNSNKSSDQAPDNSGRLQ